MTMTLDEFRTAVRVLPEPEADEVRHRFGEAFLRADDSCAGAGGAPMWRALRHRQRVSLARLWATVATNDTVTVMWDRPDDPSLPRRPAGFVDAHVLECRVVDLERGVDWLPEDLYVFDESYTWSAVFTREADVDGLIVLLATGRSVAV